MFKDLNFFEKLFRFLCSGNSLLFCTLTIGDKVQGHRWQQLVIQNGGISNYFIENWCICVDFKYELWYFTFPVSHSFNWFFFCSLCHLFGARCWQPHVQHDPKKIVILDGYIYVISCCLLLFICIRLLKMFWTRACVQVFFFLLLEELLLLWLLLCCAFYIASTNIFHS